MPRIAKKRRLLELAAARGWVRLSEREWESASDLIPGLTTSDVAASGLPADPPWTGVRQHTFEELAESLAKLTEVYAERPDLRRLCRAQVIQAKERARWAARSARVGEGKRGVKAEMVEWMLIWLGDPAIFPAWVAALRR